MSSGKVEKRADLRCILEKEPKGLGVGRGRERGSWVDVEVRSGFQAPSCPEDRAGGEGRLWEVRVWSIRRKLT